MNTLFDTTPIPDNNITIRLVGATIEVIFDTKTEPTFERQFKRLVLTYVRGIDGITLTNHYEENTRFKVNVSQDGLPHLAEIQNQIREIAHNHAHFVEDIPVQTSLF